ncbi:hypothetical protein EJ110_NYTH09656 [Nymphaea thermarum]|nr:hypothetical protein EJ110_NYTH09656 [Nymphaea thermarum]
MASSFSSFPAPQWNAISALVSIKLNGDNYLHWKSQMESVMESQDLLEYVDGTNLAPSEIISTNGKTSSNPEYKQWRKSDRLALSWIKATVSDSVLGHIVRASSAREAWIILEKAYGSQSPLRVMLLRKELHFIRKGSMSMRTYLEKIRFLADTLSAAGQQTIDSDLVQITMNGLPAEYESFITLLTAGTHQSVITFAELEEDVDFIIVVVAIVVLVGSKDRDADNKFKIKVESNQRNPRLGKKLPLTNYGSKQCSSLKQRRNQGALHPEEGQPTVGQEQLHHLHAPVARRQHQCVGALLIADRNKAREGLDSSRSSAISALPSRQATWSDLHHLHAPIARRQRHVVDALLIAGGTESTAGKERVGLQQKPRGLGLAFPASNVERRLRPAVCGGRQLRPKAEHLGSEVGWPCKIIWWAGICL